MIIISGNIFRNGIVCFWYLEVGSGWYKRVKCGFFLFLFSIGGYLCIQLFQRYIYEKDIRTILYIPIAQVPRPYLTL